jgi:transcriptional regulator of acetoin/glycerol metabolism
MIRAHIPSRADDWKLSFDGEKFVETLSEVESPPHYNFGAIECIEAIKAALTEEEFRGYCKGNNIKYTWRERHKGGNTSLQKAVWYLNQLVGAKVRSAEE